MMWWQLPPGLELNHEWNEERKCWAMRRPACVSVMHMNGSHGEEREREEERETEGASWDTLHLEAGDCGQFGKI